MEVNNSSMRPSSSRKGTRENILTMLDLCKQYDVPVTTGSDAHVDVDAGNFTYVKEVLKFCDFPEELVVTTIFEYEHFRYVGESGLLYADERDKVLL